TWSPPASTPSALITRTFSATSSARTLPRPVSARQRTPTNVSTLRASATAPVPARARADDGCLAWRAAQACGRSAVSDQLPRSVRRIAVHPLDAGPRAVPVVLHQLHPAGVVSRTGRRHSVSPKKAAHRPAHLPAAAAVRGHPDRRHALRAPHRLSRSPRSEERRVG